MIFCLQMCSRYLSFYQGPDSLAILYMMSSLTMTIFQLHNRTLLIMMSSPSSSSSSSIYIHLYPSISIYFHLYPYISIYIHISIYVPLIMKPFSSLRRLFPRTGGESIYSRRFEDENFREKIARRGISAEFETGDEWG